LLQEKKALALLRAQLEGRKEREYWNCKRFGYLAHNYRTTKGEV